MGVGLNLLLTLLGTVGAYETVIQVQEFNERNEYYKWARQYCDSVGKPLLRVGMKRSILEPPNGDYTLDIDPAVLELTDTIGVQGDERAMPFPDKMFGVCFNEHTMEHLNTIEDVELAVAESRRVADYAVLLCPSPYSLYATFFCPSHRLRLWFDNDNNRITVKPNDWITGVGKTFSADTGYLAPVGQAMVLNYDQIELPAIIPGK